MKINKIDNTSFGTKPFIKEVAVGRLSKYNINLTKGIFNAFKKLSHNGSDDMLILTIGHKKEVKKLNTDAISITLYTKNRSFLDSIIFTSSNIFKLKNVVILNPKSLEKLSSSKITKLLINNYKKLDETPIQDNIGKILDETLIDYNKVSKTHQDVLNKFKKYTIDD